MYEEVTTYDEVSTKAERARAAARRMAIASSKVKDAALHAMAEALERHQDEILAANSRDLDQAVEEGATSAFIDRLTLNEDRIRAMADGLREVANLPDPVGEVIGAWRRPNGLEVGKVRVPLGVIGIIYEGRPNVTADAAALCIKAGNAVILRGSRSAIHSNTVIARTLSDAATAAGLPDGAIHLIEDTDRGAAQAMMRMNGAIDVLIPRGGAGLIRSVVENATVPVIETGTGNCHVYVDGAADLAMAQAIVINAKVQRPGVCNAAETLLVHESVAAEFLPQVAKALEAEGVELRGCPKTKAILPNVKEATDEDWDTEYLDLILAIRVVESADEAIDHIGRHGSGHSECIVTGDYLTARRFQHEVDAAAVYVNASTRFTDGNEFGFGAEIGISTQKLHARGPMGLTELTTTKYVILGEGQIR